MRFNLYVSAKIENGYGNIREYLVSEKINFTARSMDWEKEYNDGHVETFPMYVFECDTGYLRYFLFKNKTKKYLIRVDKDHPSFIVGRSQ